MNSFEYSEDVPLQCSNNLRVSVDESREGFSSRKLLEPTEEGIGVIEAQPIQRSKSLMSNSDKMKIQHDSQNKIMASCNDVTLGSGPDRVIQIMFL